jgi:hypothetical protein
LITRYRTQSPKLGRYSCTVQRGRGKAGDLFNAELDFNLASVSIGKK